MARHILDEKPTSIPRRPRRPERRGTPLVLSLLLALLLLARWQPCAAHPMPGSQVLLDLRPDGLDVELQLPVQDLEYGFGHPLLDRPEAIVERYGGAIGEYVARHFHPTVPGGRPFELRIVEVSATPPVRPTEVIVRLRLTPPSGASPRAVDLHYDVITHEVRSHYAFVLLRHGWDPRASDDEPLLAGTIHFTDTQVVVDRRGDEREPPGRLLSATLWSVADPEHRGDLAIFLLLALLPPAVVWRQQRARSG